MAWHLYNLADLYEGDVCSRETNAIRDDWHGRRDALKAGDLSALRELPPARGRNHPAQEPAAMALLELVAALDGAHEADERGEAFGDTGLPGRAEDYSYLAQVFYERLTSDFVPSARLMRREGEVYGYEYDAGALAQLEERDRDRAAAASSS
jgi:hypothetical protein